MKYVVIKFHQVMFMLKLQNELMKKDTEFMFSSKHLSAFEQLKSKLIERPLLGIYNPLAETQLHSNYSKICGGNSFFFIFLLICQFHI